MATDTTYYLDTSLFSTATAVWTDAALTVKAADGWYQSPTENNQIYRQQTGGTLGSAANCQCALACGTPISVSQHGTGSFVSDIDMGSAAGAIIIYFQPYSTPDGILATYNSTTYNTLTSNTYGVELATRGQINFIGKTSVTNCEATDLQGNSFTVSNYIYSGSDYLATGTNTSISIPGSGTVNLNATGDLYYTMVIPKPSATPDTLQLQIVNVCDLAPLTAFDYKVVCATALPSFTTNAVETTATLACNAIQNQTYYFVKNSSTTGSNPPVADSNTVPQVGNFVFSNNTAGTALTNGFYKIAPSSVAQVADGVVSAITSCSSPTNTPYTSSTVKVSDPLACASTIDQTYYHDGSLAEPQTGDTAWSDDGVTILTNGYYKISATAGIQITGGTGNVLGPSSYALGTSFSASSLQANSANACVQSLTLTLYHNGGAPLPVATNIIYTDACKSTVAGDGYYKISTTGNGTYMQVSGGSGVVAAVTSCPAPLTSFSSSVGTTFGLVCSQSLTETYYHDGAGAQPQAGDTCYSDALGSTPLTNQHYLITGSNFMNITGGAGVIASVDPCS